MAFYNRRMNESLNTVKTLLNVWVPRAALGAVIAVGAGGTVYEGFHAATAFANQQINEASAEAYQNSGKADLASKHSEIADMSADQAVTIGIGAAVGAITTSTIAFGAYRRRKRIVSFVPQANGHRTGAPAFVNN